ncbi:MAG: cofH [Chloroflexi bacterium]|nr:cofH [Chloroflexota bacterium]
MSKEAQPGSATYSGSPLPVEGLLGRIKPQIAQILSRSLEGRELTVEEGIQLFECRGRELQVLALVADEVRRQLVGDVITYVQVRNINFTNVCYTGCRFCEFGQRASHQDAYTLEIEEVVQRAREAWDFGATEICMQGGLNPQLSGYHYRDLLVAVKKELPDIHIHSFSPFEVQYCARRTGLSVEEVLIMFKEAGLGSIPGTAAEILDTEIRQRLTKNKLTAEDWATIIKTAHRVGLPSTSTIMYGHIDAPRHWSNHIALLREIQKETGGFTEFVPLGFIHDNTRLYASGEARPGSTGAEDITMHAVSRLMLAGYINNIQVSWVKMGPKFAQQCLMSGANDFGGTLMDETISRMAGASYGEYMPPDEFRRLIWDLDRVPAQRATNYKILRNFDRAEDQAYLAQKPATGTTTGWARGGGKEITAPATGAGRILPVIN